MACEHRGCRCDEDRVTREGKHFCSEFCADAQIKNQHQDRCQCNHPNCSRK